MGAKAVDLIDAGRFGEVAVLRGGEIVGVPFDEALRENKKVSAEWLDLLHTFDA
jgi:6-phosphofructokinase